MSRCSNIFTLDLDLDVILLLLLSITFCPSGALQAELQNRLETNQLETSTQSTLNTTEAVEPMLFFLEPIFLSSDNLKITQKTSEYKWDKDYYTREQHQWNFCETYCDGLEIVEEEKYKCETVKCVGCFCDRPACEMYGLCCPDYSSPKSKLEAPLGYATHENRSVVTSESEETALSDQNPRVDAITSRAVETVKCGFSYDGYYLYIQSCPSHFQDAHIRRLCEKGYDPSDPSEGVTEDIITRVSDTVDEVVYYNKYCAICNGAKEAVPWRVEIACKHFMSVYQATTMEELLSASLQESSNCRVDQFVVPASFKFRRCPNMMVTNEEPINQCNMTGRWMVYDEDVEKACYDLIGRHFAVYHWPTAAMSMEEKGLYANMFCAICNMAGLPQHGLCSSGTGDVTHTIPRRKTPPFSVLLGFRGLGRRKLSRSVYVSSFTFKTCGDGEWSSPDGRCLPLHCSSGKKLLNGSCSTALEQIRGLGYQIKMWFSANKTRLGRTQTEINVNVLEFIHFYFLNQMMPLLEPSIEFYNLTLGAVSVHPSRETDIHHAANTPRNAGNMSRSDTSGISKLEALTAFWVSGFLSANGNISRDEAEAGVIDSLVNNNISIKHIDYEITFDAQIIVGEFDIEDFCSKSNVDCNLKRERKYFIDPDSNFFELTSSFLKLDKVLTCQAVRFDTDSYKITKLSSADTLIQAAVSLQLGETRLIFSKSKELNEISIDEHNVLNACTDYLDSMLGNLDEKRRQEFYSNSFPAEADDITEAQYYMTLVCIGVSMACLLLAIVTYFRFNVLRTMAGINNIFLCMSLLLAQGALLTSVHVSGPQTLCTILGFATHFLWLWMFTWSFICCFRVFKVFTTKTRQEKSTKSQRASCVRTVAFSVVAPTGIVCIVVVASLSTSGADRTGYGRESCYLDSELLVGLATALPLAIVTVSNIVFFSLAVAKINRVKKLQSSAFHRQGDRQNLSIYVKLSTMTGAFWLLQLLAEATDLDVLRFFAIILNGLQGVFIFVSYICNKRVLNLYLCSLGMTPIPMTTSESQKGTKTSRDSQKTGSLNKKTTESEAAASLSKNVVNVVGGKEIVEGGQNT